MIDWLKDLFSGLWAWAKPKLAALFTLTAANVAREVLALVNDAALQRLAYEAVKAAAEAGLKGNAAFDAAFAALSDRLKAEGRELADNVKDTLVQNAYLVFKNEQA